MAATPSNGNGNGWSQKYSTIVQTVTVVGLFVAFIWTGIIAPMQARILKQEEITIDMRAFNEYKADVEHRMKNINELIVILRGDVVSRGEHTAHWAGDLQRFARLQSDLEEIRQAFGGSYSIKDALAKQQRDIDDIRSRIFSPNGK